MTSPRTTKPFDWTKERVAELRALREAGRTGVEIAKHFGHGLSRSAVLGKANRIYAETPTPQGGRPGTTRPAPQKRPQTFPVPKLHPAREPREPHANVCTSCAGTRQPGRDQCAECLRAELVRKKGRTNRTGARV